MTVLRITTVLRETIGLDVESVGLASIERAIKRRLKANHLRDVSQYADLLQRSEPELETLIEAVVIPETFFFRYPEAFAAFREIVANKSLFASRKIRVLSVPCSTGEEPYSIAMSLLDDGLRGERFQIDAVDISAQLLELAKLGQFGSHSFRATELKFRDRYFRKAEAGFRLCDRVRQCVQF